MKAEARVTSSRKASRSKEQVIQMDVRRPLLEEQDLRQLYQYERPRSSVIKNVKENIKSMNSETCLQNQIPISYWLRKYQWKNDLFYDIMAGLTVAVMHIPQGMAYALLGNVSPVVGIYMAFFPVLIYVIFGTSRHISLGTFAIVCLMTGKVVTSYSTSPDYVNTDNHTQELQLVPDDNTEIYSPLQVAASVTLMVGFTQLLMYIFRLGILSTLLCEAFVNSFTTAAAIHVLLSQIFDLLGLNSARPKGNFKFFKTLVILVKDITQVNPAAIIISIITTTLMILNNELLKPWVKKHSSIPVPVELIAVVSGTLFSHYFDLSTTFNIKTVGIIPTGLPTPEVPPFSLLPVIAMDSIAITMVSYAVTMSMSLIFAKKMHYEVDSNQELFALGWSNIFGSFFSCLPVSASLSRSSIQHSVGGKTQIASIVSCLILLVILLWIGPFFEPLPRCILASIILVALKGMFVQAKEVRRFWKLSKSDTAIWVVTFTLTTMINIDVGLVGGVLASVISIFVQSVDPYSCLLGRVPDTELYLDTSRYVGVVEVFGLKIFHYAGSMNFVNANRLIHVFQKKVGVQPSEIRRFREKVAKRGLYTESTDFEDKNTLKCIIIDMSAVSRIDSTGVKTLREIVRDFGVVDVHVYLAACSGIVYDMIQTCDTLDKDDMVFIIFASVHDAVHFVQREHLSKST